MKIGKETRRSMFLIAFGVVLYVFLQNIWQVLSVLDNTLNLLKPIIAGLFISFVLNVFMRRLESLLLKIRGLNKCHRFIRGTSILICMVVAVGLIVLFSVVLIPKMIEGVQLIISMLPQAGEHINDFISSVMIRQGMDADTIAGVQNYITNMTNQLTTLMQDSSANIVSFLMSSFVSAASSAITMITGFLLAVYVLYHKEKILRYTEKTLVRFCPPRVNERIHRISGASFTVFSHFVEGQLVQGVILGTICYIGLLIIGIPYAEVISLMTGFFGLIPILGSWVSGVVSGLLIVASSPDQLVVFLIYYLILQQLLGSLVYPRIVGSQLGLPSLLVLCAILIGQALFGIIGVLIGVPLAAVLYIFYKETLEKPPRYTSDEPRIMI